MSKDGSGTQELLGCVKRELFQNTRHQFLDED